MRSSLGGESAVGALGIVIAVIFLPVVLILLPVLMVRCALANFRVDGLKSRALVQHLWRDHRIPVIHVSHQDCKGVRVAPSVYTTLQELDRFCDAVEGAIKAA